MGVLQLKRIMRCISITFFVFCTASANQILVPEVEKSPTSLLVPIGTRAVFECKVRQCPWTCSVYWIINGTSTAHDHQQEQHEDRGFIFMHQHNTTSSVYSGRLEVTASARINNTELLCVVEDGINSPKASNQAILIVISESLVTPNPSTLTLPDSIILKWSPPYLWTGRRISYYNISITDITDGTMSHDCINATFNDPVVTYNLSRRDHQECTEFIFGVSAVGINGEVLQTYEVMGRYQQVPVDLEMSALSLNILFFANLTPIVRIKLKLPSIICDHQEVNYTINVDTVNDTNIIELGPFYHRGSGTMQHDIVSSRLMRDEEYSVRAVLFTYSYTVTSHNHSFNTSFMAQLDAIPPICTKSDVVSNEVEKYNLVLGICAGVTFGILSLAILGISLCTFLKWKRHQRRRTTDTSAERVCNAMVPNPIYSGPLYESVQPRFETLTSIMASASGEEQCTSRASTPSSSEKSIRYVDPPSHSLKNRSRSFVSSGPSHSSIPTGDALNIVRSTSVSIPATKKTGKQRNKLKLTLTLTGADSTGTTSGSRNAQISTAEQISAVNPKVVQLRDVDDNYTVMSPASGRGALLGTAEWSELSPEDTEKYKE